jgi:hypothetical protein
VRLKVDLRETSGIFELNSFSSGSGPVASSYEHNNEHSGLIKRGGGGEGGIGVFLIAGRIFASLQACCRSM